ncbi:MAG: hypothetical protein GQ574_25915 [Crocinitomix sp.]|nr:hypothetical protein [Crocinitomix sp.]
MKATKTTTKSISSFENKAVKNAFAIKGGTDGDGTGLTVIIRERAPRYKGSRG